jgi:SAM-dependent methyltransferase
MVNFDSIKQIDKRYSKLAKTSCCLSCGGAIDYAKPQKGEICVDLGSGRGTDVIRMAQAAGETGFAYGIDTSQGMLTKARKTASKTGVHNVKFIDSTFENISLNDQCADLVISNCSINHASDKEAVWKQIFRILKPGGRFVVSDIYSLTEVPEQYRTDPEAVAECWAGSVERDIYLNTLENTGFSNINILEESDPYPKGAIEVASFTITAIRP